MGVYPGHDPVSCERAIVASVDLAFSAKFSDRRGVGAPRGLRTLNESCFQLAWMAIQHQQNGFIGTHCTNRLAYGQRDDKHANAMI